MKWQVFPHALFLHKMFVLAVYTMIYYFQLTRLEKWVNFYSQLQFSVECWGYLERSGLWRGFNMDSWVRRQLINVRNFLSLITIEPVFLLFSLNFGFYIVVAKDLYLQKVCKVNLNFSEEICDNIQQHKDEQVEVQQYVSSLQAYNSIVQAIPACIFALFAGYNWFICKCYLNVSNKVKFCSLLN